MLTRLEIKGFKNLVDVKVDLGPVNYIAGPNGAGKSNIFDAVHLLSLLADKPFIEAAQQVRGGTQLGGLFTVGGEDRIELACEVLIPRVGTDDFGQGAEASSTWLRYELALRHEKDGARAGVARIKLEREELSHLTSSMAPTRLGFNHDEAWRASVIRNSQRRTSFISTHDDGHVRLQTDRMHDKAKSPAGAGPPIEFLADRLPRTVLSSAQNADEHPTAALLRQEMRRWRQMQLEPSELRKADDVHSPQSITASGAHVAATLYRLAASAPQPEKVYAGISNRLAELVQGVDTLRVERDEGRRSLTLIMRDRHGVELPASALSDGTLRFIALAVIEADPEATGLLCLEEPENGIHPQRVEAMLRLLSDMAVDPNEPVGDDNPLRQVIVSTHSPVVVANAAAGDVVFAEPHAHEHGGRRVHGLHLRGVQGTWRVKSNEGMSKGAILAYLEPQTQYESDLADAVSPPPHRVKDIVGSAQDLRDQLTLFQQDS
jgi:predicted ATPase